MTDHPQTDPLSGLMSRVSLRASVFANPTVCGDWLVNTSGRAGGQFHLVARGTGYLHLRGQSAPLPLRAGDLCVLPRDRWHVISPTPVVEDDRLRLPARGRGPQTSLVCGEFDRVAGAAGALLEGLPAVIVVRAEQCDPALAALLQLMTTESLRAAPGARVVLDRLSDALLVMALRHQLAQGGLRPGLLAALADPALARLVAAVEARPAEPWNLVRMARVAGLSRTAFTERFMRAMGVPPVAWLGQFRMAEAERLFADPRQSVARVAVAVGYGTEVAFRRAFQRITGRTPGAVRRLARAPTSGA